MLQKISFIKTSILIAISVACTYNAYSQGKTILSDKTYLKGLPVEVIPYAEGKDITIKDLNLSDGDISLNYVNKVNQLVTLVLYFQFNDEVLVNYSDTSSNLTIHSSGQVMFSANGYKQTGTFNKGEIKKSMNLNVYGVYDLNGMTGKLYAFIVKGRVYSNCILPGEQNDENTFKALSNVLTVPVNF